VYCWLTAQFVLELANVSETLILVVVSVVLALLYTQFVLCFGLSVVTHSKYYPTLVVHILVLVFILCHVDDFFVMFHSPSDNC
jgi:hypothetical protein